MFTMSQQAVQTVLKLAATDATFRQQLLANPDQALANHTLTIEEITFVKSLDANTLVSRTPDTRWAFGGTQTSI